MPDSAPHMSCSLSTWSLDLRTHHVNLFIYQPAVELKVWSKDAIRNQAEIEKIEPDILEYDVKWDLETNKASGGDGIHYKQS